MYREIKERVLRANLELPKYGLVTFTWGNVSEIDRYNEVVAIKPSGVEYSEMTVNDIVVVDMEGNIVEGSLKPSSDLMTHLELYKNFPDIKGVVHTHSRYATSWAQAGKDILALGTTQADYFYGSIPCTRRMNYKEITRDYELNTGKVIIELFESRKINPNYVPGCVVYSHGPFAWGTDCFNAVHNAVVMEEVACMNYLAYTINQGPKESMQDTLLDKHFLRKHGVNAYYGQ